MPRRLRPNRLAAICLVLLAAAEIAGAQTLSPEIARLPRQQQMSLLIGWVGQTTRICGFIADREMIGRVVARYGITETQVSDGGELAHFIDEGARNADARAQRDGRQAFCAGQWQSLGPQSQSAFFSGREAR